MPLELDWYIPYRVVDLRLRDHVTLEEMKEYIRIVVDMLSTAQTYAPGKTTYLVCDTREALSIPPTYLLLAQAIPILRFKNRGPVFHITHNKTFQAIMDLTAHVTQFQTRAFTTREEAIKAMEMTMLQNDLRSTK